MTEINPRKVIDDHYDMVILKINNEFNDRLEDFTDQDLIPKTSLDYLNEDSESDFDENTSEKEEDESDNGFDLVEDERASDKHRKTTENTKDNKSQASNEKDEEKNENTTNNEEEEELELEFPIFKIDRKRVYKSLYDEEKDEPMVQFKGGSTRIRDYLNLVRSKAIEEANSTRKANLASYELNKDNQRLNQVRSIDEMRRVLFKDNFCFVLQIGYFNTESAINLSNIYTISTDFYLDQNEIKLLKKLVEGCNSHDAKYGTKFNIPLNMEKSFILHPMKEYISQKCAGIYCGNEIMRITKKTLEIEHVTYKYSNIGVLNLSADLYPAYDFSSIKSLSIEPSDDIFNQVSFGEITNLSALRNLKELKISNMQINRNSFVGLDNLIKLELIKCFIDKFESKILHPLKSLEILILSEFCDPIYLTNLPSLKMLTLENVDMFTDVALYIDIEHGEIPFVSQETTDTFFIRIKLPNLTHLSLKNNGLMHLKEEWFSRFKSLKELSLASNLLENLDFTRFKCFEKLETLDLSGNNIHKLEYKSFRNMRNLKALNLSNNRFRHYDSKPFCLDSLETLFLENVNNGLYSGFSAQLFTGLANLKHLDISNNRFWAFYPETLRFMPKLTCLIMDGNYFNNLDKSLFEHIKYFIV